MKLGDYVRLKHPLIDKARAAVGRIIEIRYEEVEDFGGTASNRWLSVRWSDAVGYPDGNVQRHEPDELEVAE